MADTKTSALTALGGAPVSTDLLFLVDVSDTTMAASGTSKYMTLANLFDSPAFTTKASVAAGNRFLFDGASGTYSSRQGATQGGGAIVFECASTDIFAVGQNSGVGVVNIGPYSFSTAISSTADLFLARKAAGRLTVSGSSKGGMTINVATTTLSAVSGATVTATSLVPARAQVIGVATRVMTGLGTGNSTTGYTVGDGSDADRFGAVTGTIAGTDTDSSTDATADPRITWSTSAADIVITAAGGNFDGTGAIKVEVYYLGDTAPTA